MTCGNSKSLNRGDCTAALAAGAREPASRSAPEEEVDLGDRKAVADLLQARRIGAAENPVVERLDNNAFSDKLTLGIVVTVEAELGERPEIRRRVHAVNAARMDLASRPVHGRYGR